MNSYEEDLFASLVENTKERLEPRIGLKFYIFEREMLKIALGLSCNVLGETFVQSDAANKLREWLFDPDFPKKFTSSNPIGKGFMDSKPTVTTTLFPGSGNHFFILTAIDQNIVFFANFFGEYEVSIVMPFSSNQIPLLPGSYLPGYTWEVDPKTKETKGPERISAHIKRICEEHNAPTRRADYWPKKPNS